MRGGRGDVPGDEGTCVYWNGWVILVEEYGTRDRKKCVHLEREVYTARNITLGIYVSWNTKIARGSAHGCKA